MPKEIDLSRTSASQPHRTTKAAQDIARRLRISDDGRIVTVRPLADVLSPTTRATLDAITKGAASERR